MSSTPNLASQVGQALSGVGFSLATPLYVPCLNSSSTSPLSAVSEPFDHFVRTAAGGASSYQVSTKWGGGDVVASVDGDKAAAGARINPVCNTPGDSIEFTMRSGVNGDKKRYVGAVLTYQSSNPFFAIMQLGHLRGANDSDRIIMTRAGGIGAIAVLSGMELLSKVAHLRADLGDASWKEVMGTLDDGISPMTAFSVAQILSEELYPGGYANRWELYADGTNSGPLATGRDGRMFANPKIERTPRTSRVRVQTLARNVGIEPGEYMRDFLPTATVSYLPAGAFSHIIRGNVPEPAIEVVQNGMFSKRGQPPYTEAVADLVLGAAGLRPSTFPLVR